MKHIQFRKIYYHLSHRYFTLNNAVIAVAFLIAASWTWGAIQVMQRNYDLQQSIARKQQELMLKQLETKTQEFEKRYYQSDEYKELAVRESLGYGLPGEKVIILPPNSPATEEPTRATTRTTTSEPLSNFQQWMIFLLGSEPLGT